MGIDEIKHIVRHLWNIEKSFRFQQWCELFVFSLYRPTSRFCIQTYPKYRQRLPSLQRLWMEWQRILACQRDLYSTKGVINNWIICVTLKNQIVLSMSAAVWFDLSLSLLHILIPFCWPLKSTMVTTRTNCNKCPVPHCEATTLSL